MIKRHTLLSILRATFLIAVLLLVSSPVARAVDIQFFQSNDILYYLPNDADRCPTGTSQTGQGIVVSTGNTDYKDRPIIPEGQLEKIKKFQPIYEKAQSETGVPWQIFAVLHIRESVLADFNPDNGQGIYQDFERGGGPYPPGKITEEEMLRQTIYAGKIVQEKAGDNFDLVKSGDANAIKDMFFGYNGRASVYIEQAIKLGFTDEEARRGEGSPYVMNIADEKRDPEVAKDDGTWGQIKQDLGRIEYPANYDYGAFLMYTALAGVESSGDNVACGGLAAGETLGDMIIYYQVEEPWASKPYGPYEIRGWGCGPTSTAMVIATLKKDPSINPENMAAFFYNNGWLVESGTSWAAWESGNALERTYGVKNIELGTDMSKAAEALRRNSLVIISVTGTPFTCPGCGHILVLRGVTSSGNFLVANPASREQTENEEGFDIQNPGSYGIRNMWEIRL